MNFTRVDAAIAACKKRLVDTDAIGTAVEKAEIEGFLVRYLLVLICAEYERCVKEMLVARAVKAGDAHLVKIMKNWAKMSIKRMKIGDLSQHLENLGDDYRDAFNAKTMHTPASAAWSNIQTNRNEVAHVVGPMMTLAGLENDFIASKPIAIAFAESLGMTAAEIAAFTWP